MKHALIFLAGVVIPASAIGDAGPQILAHVDVGDCECPLPEIGLTCDDVRVEIEHIVPAVVHFYANGVEQISEVHFGVESDPPEAIIGWRICGQFIDNISPPDVFSDHYDVSMISPEGCHVIEEGFHFLVCFGLRVNGPVAVRLVPHSTFGEARIVTCDGTVIPVAESALGAIGIAGPPGYNPCKDPIPTPTESSSWSSVKALY